MRKLSESVWVDIHKRSTKETDRKENLPGNMSELKPVDMGVSVLWADRDFIMDDKAYFTYDDLQEYFNDTPWRIPTESEVVELEEMCTVDSDKDSIMIVCGQNKLVFERMGYYDSNGILESPSYYYGWTSTSGTMSNFKHTYIIDGVNIRYFSKRSGYDKLPVRLVKSK